MLNPINSHLQANSTGELLGSKGLPCPAEFRFRVEAVVVPAPLSHPVPSPLTAFAVNMG